MPIRGLSWLKNPRDRLQRACFRRRVHRRDFTIVSNDCWGGEIYRVLGLPYLTPFAGLLVYPEDLMRLLADFRAIMRSELTFKPRSKNEKLNLRLAEEGTQYPIGCIGDDIEIHFLHYATWEEARDKWNRRTERMTQDDDNLFIKFSDSAGPPEEMLRAFDALGYRHKVCFVGRPRPELTCGVLVPDPVGGDRVPLELYRDIYKNRCFDAADWLNGGPGRPGGLYRLLTGRPRQRASRGSLASADARS